ncbi:MAG: AAA family ATPase [Proteobacteria bacterium]|nr:AAA family ATPase [Pseudomonadota bacterium]
MNTPTTITFQIEEVRFNRPETGWSVLAVRNLDSGEQLVVTGQFQNAQAGEVMTSVGTPQKHPIFGAQWASVSYEYQDPIATESLVKFIQLVIFAEIPGLGKKSAEKIVGHFQEKTLDILDHHPEELAKIKGFSAKKIALIKQVWHTYRGKRHIVLFLTGHGLSVHQARQVLNHLPSPNLATLKQNPYVLIHRVSGLGFKRVDRLAISSGIAKEHPLRIRAAILFILKSSSEQYGHSCVPKLLLARRLPGLLGILPNQLHLDDHLHSLTQDGEIILTQGHLDELTPEKKHIVDQMAPHQSDDNIIYCSLMTLHQSELRIVSQTIAMLKRPKIIFDQMTFNQWLMDYQSESGLILNSQQKQAVFSALTEPIFIVTGGAGVGKSTTLNAMLWVAKRAGDHVALASPTGRAAQRIKEVTGESAKTLHRLLEWSPHESCFGRNEDKPLTEDLVLIDECSMIDLYLGKSLWEALAVKRTRLVLMGDPHQLPSVGPGRLLADLIASQQVPTITLNEVFRQAAHSPIIQASQAILAAKMPNCFPGPHQQLPPANTNTDQDTLNTTTSCSYQNVRSPREMYQAIRALVAKTFGHFEPLTDIQVLTPINKGPYGCDGLNIYLQNYFQKQSSKSPHHNDIPAPSEAKTFVVGDKVIQTVNNYELGVFNGDIGYVLHKDVTKDHKLDSLVVRFHQVDTGGGRNVNYSKQHLADLKLAYAITIHKAQGSEFPVVIIPVVKEHRYMLSGNMLYTALTRAKKHAVFLGDMTCVADALKTHAIHPRFTGLQHLFNTLKT